MKVDPKDVRESVRILCSYHDSEIMKHYEAINHHEQMKMLVLGLGFENGVEEPESSIPTIYLGPHSDPTKNHRCMIQNIHLHNRGDESIFVRPQVGTHYKVEGKCRIVTGRDGEYVNCSQHKEETDSGE